MKPLKFLHITKCGGTSIENIGKKNDILWGIYDKDLPFHHNPLIRISKEVIENNDWFMVVRNPYERILSEYYCEWGGQGRNKQNYSKEYMNEFLMYKIKNREVKEVIQHYGHYIPQYIYLQSSYINKNNIHILKLENLKDDFENLMKKYNLDHVKIDLHDNKSVEKKYTINDFSIELINLINKVYHNDFEFFNYDKITF